VRLLIVSDLHANASALERVVEHADAVVVLGDLVDYGPDPEATIDWVRRNATYAVRGNHDEAVASGAPTGASERLVEVAEEARPGREPGWPMRTGTSSVRSRFAPSSPSRAQRSPRFMRRRQIRFGPTFGRTRRTSDGSPN
jgi:hypothetical protein